MENNKMLIDATHPEETRVVVLRDGRVEEFDFESAARKLLRGNIYLAKVTRVEPSLQAAFVDYGGNRHGFLAFNEIHPDYYQIPVADRQALLDDEAEAEAEYEAARDSGRPPPDHHERDGRDDESREPRGDNLVEPLSPDVEHATRTPAVDFPESRSFSPEREQPSHYYSGAEPGTPRSEEPVSRPLAADNPPPDYIEAPLDEPRGHGLVEEVGVVEVDTSEGENGSGAGVEEVGSEDAMEEVPERPRRRHRRVYKIQEVIKRRQIILVQVVKEERGNKGAALTTYLSLAGRYTVLMPNTGRGGGISRKITNPQDRRRLKAIANELEVPEGMGLIIRTAGASRTQQEIKRDFEYLLRLWENVRDMTLRSTAPALVYEEGDLIKRSIRDLYTKDVSEIIVAGEPACTDARDFMRMLMPSHVDNVTRYEGREPLFTRFGIERQLGAMFSPYVTLRSGGYIVINQTEALVSIDVNSGRSTREFSIEETALNTNLEAAEEISRQLKLRDLAGLIVIDFIDMEEKRNNRSVERRLKDSLRHDRARIQVGRISHFGLLEMSRQRLRTGVLEGSTTQCPHCSGTGIVRSNESVALAVLRGLEDALAGGDRGILTALTTAPVALYILNHKRAFIEEMEQRYSVRIVIEASDRIQGANFQIERSAARVEPERRPERGAVNMEWGFDGEEAAEPAEPRGERGEIGEEGRAAEGEGEGEPRRRRRRRRRGRGEGSPRDMQPAPGYENGQENGQRLDHDHGHAPEFDEARGHDRDPETRERGYEAEQPHGGERLARETGDDRDMPVGGEVDEPVGEASGAPGEDRGERDGRRRRRRGRRGGRRGREQGGTQPYGLDEQPADHQAGPGQGDAPFPDEQHLGERHAQQPSHGQESAVEMPAYAPRWPEERMPGAVEPPADMPAQYRAPLAPEAPAPVVSEIMLRDEPPARPVEPQPLAEEPPAPRRVATIAEPTPEDQNRRQRFFERRRGLWGSAAQPTSTNEGLSRDAPAARTEPLTMNAPVNAPTVAEQPVAAAPPEEKGETPASKRGWWQRRLSGEG